MVDEIVGAVESAVETVGTITQVHKPGAVVEAVAGVTVDTGFVGWGMPAAVS